MTRYTSFFTRAALAAVTSIFAVQLLAAPASADPEKYASIVVDADTNEVLHARHADELRYPASLTKAMTLYMAFDAIKSGEVALDDNIIVSTHAASMPPSKLGLRAGSTISVEDAVYSLVTKSANDIAAALGEHLGGTESGFAELMTTKARNMGMTNTTFRNASGLPDDEQFSTARDMAILAERLLEDHADYYRYFSTREFKYGSYSYSNHNKLLDDVEGVDGIKTGYTRASGFNLMTSAKRDGRRVIAIMFGGSTSRTRNAHVTDLIEAAYKTFESDQRAPDLRRRLAFSALQSPLNPNAAALPMLNGEVFAAAEPAGEGDQAEIQ